MDQCNPYNRTHPYGCDCSSCHNHIITEPMFDNGTKPIGTTIDITPPDMFFGSKGVGEPVPTQKVTVTNNSPNAIRILDISITDIKSFKFGPGFVAPSVIQPGASFDVPVQYMAIDIGQTVAQVIIDTDEDRLNYSVGLSGRVVSQSGGGGGSGGGDYDDTALRNYVDQSLKDQYDGFTALVTDQRWATADELGAEAGYRLTLAATLRDEIEARVMVEYIARVTALEAEATARLELSAEYYNNKATVTESFRVYSNQFSAEAYARLELEALVEANQARFEESESAIATKFSAEVTARSELEARVSNYSDSLIEEERTVRATQFASEATARELLKTNFETLVSNADTRISNEVQARTDALGALAQRVSTIEANYTTGGDGESGVDTVARAQVRDEATARANADESLATRIETVEVSYQTAGMVEQIATALVQSEATARANADNATATRIDAVVTAFNTAYTNANTRIQNEETARADAIEAVATTVASLSASFSNAANWVPDSEFVDLRNWKMTANGLGGTQSINGGGEFWRPVGQNVMALASGLPVSEIQYIEIVSEPIPVTTGDWIQFYMMGASHRANNWCTLYFYNADNLNIAYAGENMSATSDRGGRDPGGWDQTGKKSFKVPDGAIYCRLALRKYDTFAGKTDSIAWFWRPYVGPAREGQATWNPYTPGSTKNNFAITDAYIAQVNTARATADEAFATQLNTMGAEYRTLDSATKALIAEETTARTTAISAETSARNSIQAQINGTASSGLRDLVNGNRRNLIDLNWWKEGAIIPWFKNGGARNEIVSFPHGSNFDGLGMPDGSSGDAWLCQADSSGAEAGGWGGPVIEGLDPDKTYRFMIPIAPLNNVAERSSYWGTNGVCNLNTTTLNDNPYFAVGNQSILVAGKWYLFVGYVFPRNSKVKTNQGAGIYDMATGYVVAGGANYCFHPDGRSISQRAYQFYSTEGAYQAFGRPVVELVDGNETPIGSIFNAVGNANARITVEETTRATADGALSSRISTIEASYISTAGATAIAAAKVAEEATARTNALGAFANTINTVDANWREANGARFADIGNLSTDIVRVDGRVATEETTRANADGALSTRISTVEASYISGTDAANIAAAKVAEEATARANADGALASTISSVSATANGASSTASAALTAAQSADGKLANARVEFVADTGGGRVGLTLRSDVNGGAGIDLQGDVTFKGSLNVGPDSGQRTKIVNEGVRVYDANGTMRVRLGIW